MSPNTTLQAHRQSATGYAVMEMNAVPVGLHRGVTGVPATDRAWFSAVGLFLGRKSKISHEKMFQFSIFQLHIRLSPAKISGF